MKRKPAAALASRIRTKRKNTVPVFLIRDNREIRNGLAAMLNAQGLKLVATAQGRAGALRQVTRMKPQLVLIDAALSGRAGLKLVQSVRKASPGTRVIVTNLLAADQQIVVFARAGVSGFIMQDASATEFVQTIRTVADGGSVLPSRLVGSLFDHVASQALTLGKRDGNATRRLTAREKEVTGLIARGLSNKDIAGRLDIAAHTVRSHVHNILEKLALNTRLEVAAHANGNRG